MLHFFLTQSHCKCLRRLKPPLFQRSKHPSRPQYAQLFQLRCPFRQKIQPLAVNFINSLRLLLQNLLCKVPKGIHFLCPSTTFRRNRLALCRLLLPQQCQKMSLALQPVRIESGAVRIRCKPFRKAVFLCNRHQLKFGMAFQKIANAFFVFLRRKGTGGIKEHPACLEHRCACLQNLRLLTAAKRKHIRIPAFHHIRLLTEHSLAAARRIHQNLIKKIR